MLVIMIGYRLGLARFYWIGVVTVLLGALTAWLPLETMMEENALFFSLYGLLWMISGAFTLARYLRSTQPLEPTGDKL